MKKLTVGTVVDGLTYQGGDPYDPSSWLDGNRTRGAFETANDYAIEAGNAATGFVKTVSDAISPGNRVSQALGDFIKSGEEKQSDVAKAAKLQRQFELENADGLLDEALAFGQYALKNPGLTAAEIFGNIGPVAGVVRRAGAAAFSRALGNGATKEAAAVAGQRAATGAGVALGGVSAGGDAAGSAYDLVMQIPEETLGADKDYQSLLSKGVAPDAARKELATRAARQAQVLPSLVGAASGAIGLEKMLGAPAGTAKFRGNALSRGLKAGAVEAVPEGFEEGLTTFEANRAAQDLDPSIDPLKGVGFSAAFGAVAGGVPAAGLGALSPARPSAAQERRAKLLEEAQRAIAEGRMADAAIADAEAMQTLDLVGADLTRAVDSYLAPTIDQAEADPLAVRNLAGIAPLDARLQTASAMGERLAPNPVNLKIGEIQQAIEQRGGAATQEEADFLQKYGAGQPFDRIATAAELGLPSGAPKQQVPTSALIDLDTTNNLRETSRQAQPAPAFEPSPDLQGAKRQPVPELDRVNAFVNTMRRTNTPAAQAFVKQYDTGVLTDADVQQALFTQGRQGNEVQSRLTASTEGRAPAVEQTAQQLQQAAAQNPVATATARLEQAAQTGQRNTAGRITIARSAQRSGQTLNLGDGRSATLVSSDSLATTSAVARSADGKPVRQSMTKAQYKVMSQVARIFGKQIQLFNGVEDDGFVVRGDNKTIYLNTSSSIRPTAVMFHEMAHLMQVENREAYKALRDVVMKQATPEQQKNFAKYYDASEDFNEDELVADVFGSILEKPETLNKVLADISASYETSVARKIIINLLAALNKAVNALLATFKTGDFKTVGEFVGTTEADLQALKDAVRTAAATYAKQQRIPAMQMQGEMVQAEGKLKLDSATNAVDSEVAPTEAVSSTERGDGADDENLRKFAQNLRQEVKASVETNRALSAAYNWQYNEGDLLFSTTTSKTYKITGKTFRKSRGNLEPAYLYEADNGDEKGMLLANKVKESTTLRKIGSVPVGAGEVKFSTARVMFEVAPDPNDRALKAKWDSFDQVEKSRISNEVLTTVMPEILKAAGLKAKDVTGQIGGYLDDSNPSFTAIFDSKKLDLAKVNRMAKLAGFALAQDSMMVVADKPFDGSFETGFITLELPESVDPSNIDEVHAVYQAVRALDPESIQGHTTVGREMGLAVPADKMQELIDRIAKEVKVDFPNVDDSKQYMAFPSKEDYNYGNSEQNNGQGAELAEERRAGVDLRARADQALREAFERRNIQPRVERSSVPFRDKDGFYVRRTLGLNPDPKGREINRVRQIAQAFDLYLRRMAGLPVIELGDYSEQARDTIAEAIADEVAYQIQQSNSGLGWYSSNYPAALKKLGRRFPELKNNENARMVFSALVAITSNGEDVVTNAKKAVELYSQYRAGTPMSELAASSRRGDAMNNGLLELADLMSRMSLKDLRSYLLQETTVAEMNRERRAQGKKPDGSYKADTKVPRSALAFGPKIGAFFANLMGAEGYLTMDLWWTRSINRMRGLLVPEPTESSLVTLRSLLGLSEDASTEELFNKARPYRSTYEANNFRSDLEMIMGRKEGTTNESKNEFHAEAREKLGAEYPALYRTSRLQKAANTVLKTEEIINEAPQNASDREFMYAAAKKSAEILKEQTGKDLTIADIQAALWYYEKKLYEAMSGAKKGDVGYDEAISQMAEQGDAEPTERKFKATDREPAIKRSTARAIEEIKSYAQTLNEDFFRTPTITNTKDATEIGKRLGLSIRRQDIVDQRPHVRELYVVNFEGGREAYITVARRDPVLGLADGDVYVNVGGLEPGDEGSRVYMAAGALAYNRQLRLVGDPDGITEAGKRRRLENMITLALKYNSASFFAPHKDMLGWNGLQWRGSDDQKLAFMLQSSYAVSSRLVPEIKNVIFEENTGEFRRIDDQSRVPRSAFVDMARRARESASPANRDGMPGSGTLRLGVIYKSLASLSDSAFIDPAGLSPRESEERTRALRDSTKGIRASTARGPLGFYSKLEKSVTVAPKSLKTGLQWAQWVAGGKLKELGVKQDEIEWSGLGDFLQLKGKEPVSLEDVQDYLRNNGVQVEEVTLGGGAPEQEQLLTESDIRVEPEGDQGRWFIESPTSNVLARAESEEAAIAFGVRYFNSQIAERNRVAARDADNTKYRTYTLPGGENYREVLLTLPEKKPVRARSDFIAEMKKKYERDDWYNAAAEGELLAFEDLRDAAIKEREKSSYSSRHWEQPNVIAHIRVNDRTDAEGNKVLFIEELQSDWGQEGKKQGFRAKDTTGWKVQGTDPEDPSQVEVLDREGRSVWQGTARGTDRQVIEQAAGTGLPAAPFVTDTKGWLGLGLKRVITMAVQGGYDKVAFVTGQQSADRYDLRKTIDYIEYEQTSPGEYFIQATDRRGGRPLTEYRQTPEQLENLIGKDLTKQVVSGEGEKQSNGNRLIRSKDFKLGGEGMLTFYDKIVPQEVRSLIKKFDGMLGPVEVNVGDKEAIERWERMEARFPSGSTPIKKSEMQPGFAITDKMREVVSKEGLPLFSRSRQTETPEFKAWFGDSQAAVLVNPSTGLQVESSKEPAVSVPQVMYHTTRNDFTEFEIGRLTKNSGTFGDWETQRYAVFVTPELQASEVYGKSAGGFLAGANVMPLYVKAEKPLDFTSGMVTSDVERQFEEAGFNPRWLYRFDWSRFDDEEGKHFVETAKSLGYDSVIFNDENPDTGESFEAWAVFEPTQLKSAIGNNGQFDPTNPDIRFSKDRAAYLNAVAVALDTDASAGKPLPVMRENPLLDVLGMRKAPVVTNVNNIRKKMFGDHQMTRQEIEDLFEGIYSPAMVFDSDTQKDGSVVLVTGKMKGSMPIVAVIKPESAFNNMEVRLLKTAFGKDGYGVMNRWYEEGLLRYFDKEKALDPTFTVRVQFPWVAQLARKLPSSVLGPADVFNDSEIKRSTNRSISPAMSKLDDVIYKLQDKNIDLRRVTEAIRKNSGELDDEVNAYQREELYHGRAAKQSQDFLNRELRPLLDEMKARKVSLQDFETYLWNRHAEERNVAIAKVNDRFPDGGSGIKTADARAYLANLDPDKRRAFEALAARVDAMTSRNLQMMVDSGLETQETVDAMRGAYKSYVPLLRGESSSYTGRGQGYSIKGATTKRALGSDKPVENILSALADQREKIISRAEKARVGRAVMGLALQNPQEDFWFVFDPLLNRDATQRTELRDQLEGLGLDPDLAEEISAQPYEEYIGPNGRVSKRPNRKLMQVPNALAVRIAGEDKFVVFNQENPRAKRMAEALTNMDAPQLEGALGVLGKISRYFASINTQYNPVFGIVNLIRDTQGAMLNLTSTKLAGKQKEVLAGVASAVAAIYRVSRAERNGGTVTGPWADVYERFLRQGGQTGYRDMFDNPKDRTQRQLRKELTPNAMEQAWSKSAGPVFDWLSDYNETLENSVRLSAFKTALDSGMSDEQAASLAKNLTVNFNRKGQIGVQAGALYAFYNASTQGTARLLQTMAGPMGKKIAAGGVLLGVAQTLMLAAAGYDDDQPPEFVRERNLVIPTGGGQYLTLPMPLGPHVLPNIGRVIAEQLMGRTRQSTVESLASVFGTLVDAFNPVGSSTLLQTLSPTVLDPAVALAENKDFSGKNIARADMNENRPTPGYTRTKENSLEVLTSISKALNYLSGGSDYTKGVVSPTPDQLEYVIGQVTGGVGRELSKLWQVAETTATGEELPSYKVPLLGRLYGSARDQASEGNQFYANLRAMNDYKLEITGRAKNGEDYQSFLAENPEAGLFKAAENVEQRVQELRRLKRNLKERDADPAAVAKVEDAITRVMRNFNQQVALARGREVEVG